MWVCPNSIATMARSPQFCLLLLALLFARGQSHHECQETRCGHHGPPIRFPFHLKGDHRHPEPCGYPGFHLSCTDDKQTVLELPAIPVPARLYLSSIDYKNQKIRVYDPRDCLATQILRIANSSSVSIFRFDIFRNVSFLNCPSFPCGIYAMDSNQYMTDAESDLLACTKILDVSFVDSRYSYYQYFDLGTEIWMSWSKPDCGRCEAQRKQCGLTNNATQHQIDCFDFPKGSKIKVIGIILGSFFFTLVVIVIFGVHRLYKLKKDYEIKIESFLEDYKALKPTRYSHNDIKKITNQFEEKLGQGAYGTVYKGKLSNEISVAIKILNHSKGNGEEFINEVGTMGTIHHVNVVRLVGFCADGFQRALVYEFLPNGSLERFICSLEKKNHSLGWDKLQDIALGIARGIEYLHDGCEQQILHFDIKPQNILLDQYHNPKIADFGLAKLCSKDQSGVSVTTARGTVGYIAPEVFSRNFGKVSFKSDVYSFGILLLEIVGGRKCEDGTAQDSGQVYYPEWIYNLLVEGEEDLRIHIEEEKEAEIAKKLAIVGLCCIQWHPIDRPSMKVVVQMLEGDGSELSVPPNPFTSTTPKTSMNAINPKRGQKQELEIIPELE